MYGSDHNIDRRGSVRVSEEANERPVCGFSSRTAPLVIHDSYSWSPGKNPMNTVHTCDIARASWALAQWMSGLGRKEADKLAGEDIPPNDKNKVKEATDLPEADRKLTAPLFNLVSSAPVPLTV